MHSHIVAHQTFAQRLVSWVLGIMDYSSSFRALLGKASFKSCFMRFYHNVLTHLLDVICHFTGSLLLECPNEANAMFGASSKSTRLESFVRNDTVLWKSARTAVHHFLISSLLIGNDSNRKSFASIYSR